MADNLLQAPSNVAFDPLTRTASSYRTFHDYDLAKAEGYKQQYGDMYFLRLAKLKPSVEQIAEEAWDDFEVAGEKVHKVERVLDVRQGELCWVVGTVYMDMPLKPSILDDISKDQWIAAPPPLQKYTSSDGSDKVMLEDESGRLRLIGASLQTEILVTGCIIAVMGTEQANGDFEVIDIRLPDLAPQPQRWAFDSGAEHKTAGGKIAIISGLDIKGDVADSFALDLLQEWLLGESTSASSATSAAQVTRLIIAGNSLAEASPINVHDDNPAHKKPVATKKYGYDSSIYNPIPSQHLDAFLSSLAPSLPITLIPGASDPVNVSIPQQPLHPALFPQTRVWAAPPKPNVTAKPTGSKSTDAGSHPFHPATNPALLSLSGHLVLGTGGQTVDDIAKYMPFTQFASAMDLVEATLRWRIVAPTAPDTLWCYPYQTGDPFVIRDGMCPHLYVVGNQEAFETRLVKKDGGPEAVRCICVPRFSKTGEMVLVDMDTLEVEVVKFALEQEA